MHWRNTYPKGVGVTHEISRQVSEHHQGGEVSPVILHPIVLQGVGDKIYTTNLIQQIVT